MLNAVREWWNGDGGGGGEFGGGREEAYSEEDYRARDVLVAAIERLVEANPTGITTTVEGPIQSYTPTDRSFWLSQVEDGGLLFKFVRDVDLGTEEGASLSEAGSYATMTGVGLLPLLQEFVEGDEVLAGKWDVRVLASAPGEEADVFRDAAMVEALTWEESGEGEVKGVLSFVLSGVYGSRLDIPLCADLEDYGPMQASVTDLDIPFRVEFSFVCTEAGNA